MATLSASRRNSANSNPSTPRPSISGNSIPRMSSLNEEESALSANETNTCVNTNGLDKTESDLTQNEKIDCHVESIITKIDERIDIKKIEEDKNNESSLKYAKDNKNENMKTIRTRACSERSDSGISDCSSHITSSSCTSTPLLGKKFRINEEAEYNTTDDNKFNSTSTLILNNNRFSEECTDTDNKINLFHGNKSNNLNIIQEDRKSKPKKDEISDDKHNGLSLKLSNKIETFNGNTPVKCK
ncbi:hypothetical protein NQ314_005685 [Rhamnusium bicolor]|uniref:Exophilin 5 n=1 Tax=Rhamnusium bicolor TaxID=1586634 RepID=A0AAV8ZGW4_9CUCU|nr:hypothetical protein NQ314_005685 [Rhamnusium bicolor]